MAKKRSKSTPSGIRQVTRTSKAKYTEQILKTGQTVYRKNGRFVKAAVFNGAQGAAIDRETTATIGVDPRGRSYDSQEFRYYDSKNRLRAGRLAPQVIPGLKPGQMIDKETARKLGLVFAEKQQFFTFANQPETRRLSRSEVKRRYLEFRNAIAKAKTQADRASILREYWPSNY